MVDADPQCNLTGTVLGFNGATDFDDFYQNNFNSDIKSCLAPALQGSQTPLVPADPIPTSQANLFLLAGHIDLSLSDAQLAVALSTGATALPALGNLPGSLGHLLRITAYAHEMDAVIIDMSPSVGAINECLLMASDYFMVPTLPDFFCNQAIRSLANILPRWNTELTQFRATTLNYPIPVAPPQFIGTISQRYRPWSGSPAAAFQKWIDTIKITVNTELVPTLHASGMSISEAHFKASNPEDEPFNIINIPDFNSLMAQSHTHNTPVFALSDAQIERQGVVLDTMKTNRDSFRTSFESMARSVEILAGI